MSISWDDDTDSTEELDGEYDSEHDSDVDMHMEDDVDAPGGVNLDGDVDMERDGDNEEEDNEEENDDEEVEEVDEDKDEDEDDGKEHWTIGQGEMVNTPADDVDTIVDNQPTCYLSKAKRCASIPHGHKLWPLPHGHNHRCLTHDHKPRWLNPSMGWSFLGLWLHKNLAHRRPPCETRRQLVTRLMSM